MASQLLQWLTHALHAIVHLDVYLNQWIQFFGPMIYVVLFVILFCETGLIVTPFLPGDSLLFALGALSVGDTSTLSFPILLVLLIVAAILGDAVNYAVGRRAGPRIFRSEKSFLFNRKHLVRTQDFYEKYGGKTIIIARFIPIVRTFAPFVAGIGKMRYPKFALYNVVGAVLWVSGFLTAGVVFGNIPAVKKNFHYVIFGIIFVSILPPIIEWMRSRRSSSLNKVPT